MPTTPTSINDTRDRRELDSILQRADNDGRLDGIDAGRVAHLARRSIDRSVRRDAKRAYRDHHRDQPLDSA